MLMLLLACATDPVSTNIAKDNPNVMVDKLFTEDSCTVYRFKDGGRPHYFAKCEGQNTSSVSSVENCGKNCTREVEIPTVTLTR